MNYLKLFLMAMITLSITACDKTEDNNKNATVEDGSYTGTLTVDQTDGTIYTQQNVNVTLQLIDGKAQIKMSQVAFSAQMPVKLDMTIPGITTAENAEGITISGDNIVPQAMGGDFPKYTIKQMNGKATPTNISFAMICGTFPLSFTGTANASK